MSDRGKVGQCEICHKEYILYRANQKRCSKECTGAMTPVGRYIIFERDEFRCIYCGQSSLEDGIKLTLDHIIPQVAHGIHEAGNLVTVCSQCNSEKGGRILPNEAMMRLLKIVSDRNRLGSIHDHKRVKVLE